MTIEISTEGFVAGGGSGATGSIVSISPSPDQAQALAETDNGLKFTPISAIVELGSGDSMWVYVSTQNMIHRWLIYDPLTGFTPPYSELSSVVSAPPNPNTSAPRQKITVLPYGGWPEGNHSIHIVSGVEVMIGETDQVDRWTKIDAELTLNTGDNLFVFYSYHDIFVNIFDVINGMSPLFANISTVSDTASNPVEVVLRPNGGWQSDFELKFISGIELQSSGGILG